MKKANKMMALTMAAAMLVPQMAFAGESERQHSTSLQVSAHYHQTIVRSRLYSR